jgi:orotate phosphoribosyltransferase
MHFADQALVAEITARMLLEVKAVLFFESKPFIFTSGWASPVYIDCRKLIFYPRIRCQLVDFAAATLARDAGFEQFDVVAGGETAGIPYAASAYQCSMCARNRRGSAATRRSKATCVRARARCWSRT